MKRPKNKDQLDVSPAMQRALVHLRSDPSFSIHHSGEFATMGNQARPRTVRTLHLNTFRSLLARDLIVKTGEAYMGATQVYNLRK